MATVQPARTGRRVVRRHRPTLDQAWDTVLADLPGELHTPMRRYVEAKRAEFDARHELSTVLSATGTAWYTADRIARELAFPEPSLPR